MTFVERGRRIASSQQKISEVVLIGVLLWQPARLARSLVNRSEYSFVAQSFRILYHGRDVDETSDLDDTAGVCRL
jgi:hypothetical protein